MGRSRLLVIVGIALILTISVFAFVRRSSVDGPLVSIGSITEFPVGSVTYVETRVKVIDPHPEIADQFTNDQATFPLFVVNHPEQGVLVLSVFDPHLGCRIHIADQIESDIGVPLPVEIAFANPCHGEKYNLAGAYVAGPAPRGMDRFGVAVVDGEITVDFSAFNYGPDRAG